MDVLSIEILNKLKRYNHPCILKNKKIPLYLIKNVSGDTRPFALANESLKKGSRKNSRIHYIWSKTR